MVVLPELSSPTTTNDAFLFENNPPIPKFTTGAHTMDPDNDGFRRVYNGLNNGALTLDTRFFPTEDAWIDAPTRILFTEFGGGDNREFCTPDLMGPIFLLAPTGTDELLAAHDVQRPYSIHSIPHVKEAVESGPDDTFGLLKSLLAAMEKGAVLPSIPTTDFDIVEADAFIIAYPWMTAEAQAGGSGFPCFPAHIGPGIMQSSGFVANTPSVLAECNIKFVVNAAREFKSPYADNSDPSISYIHIPMDDDLEQELDIDALETAVAFLSQCSESQRGLVHCAQGISRSSAITIYFMVSSPTFPHITTCDQALDHLRDARSIARPNPNFLHQLHQLLDT